MRALPRYTTSFSRIESSDCPVGIWRDSGSSQTLLFLRGCMYVPYSNAALVSGQFNVKAFLVRFQLLSAPGRTGRVQFSLETGRLFR